MEEHNSFTIEKFKLNERMQGVETQVALLRQAIDDLKLSKNDVHEHILNEMTEYRKLLYGTDTKSGLIIEVNDLTKSAQTRSRHLAVLYATLISLVVHSVWRHFVINSEINQMQTHQTKVPIISDE